MSIVLLVEGKTETALKGCLKRFLDERAQREGRSRMALLTKEIKGTLSQAQWRTRIRVELDMPEVQAVVGLVDVYPQFDSAAAAKAFLREAASHDPRFHAHTAQYDVEAWLLPYWEEICRRLKVRRAPPGDHPEQVNHLHPPSQRLAELYRQAKPARNYVKTTEMAAILQKQDLLVAAEQCPEFRALLNTLLGLANLKQIV